MEIKKQDKKSKKKLFFWWWFIGGLASISLLTSVAFVYPTFASGNASNNSEEKDNNSSDLISNVSLNSIDVVRLPYKLEFTNFESINTAGGKLRLNYSNGTSTIIDMNDEMIDYSKIDLSEIGKKNVILNYNGVFTNYQINQVDYKIAVQSVNFLIESLTLNQGASAQIYAEISPINATNSGYRLTSSDPNIVSVDNTGLITGLKPGIATITVIAENSKTDQLLITVKEVIDQVSVTYLKTLIQTLENRIDSLLITDYTIENYQLIIDLYKEAISDIYDSETSDEANNRFNKVIKEISNIPVIPLNPEVEIDDPVDDQNEGNQSLIIPIATLAELDQIDYNSTSTTLTFNGTQYNFEIGEVLSANYKLTANIDLSTIPSWTPIGSSTNPFTGVFDGGGYTISNLTITTKTNNTGLFGVLGAGASVKDVILNRVQIFAETANNTLSVNKVGALAGIASGTSVKRVIIEDVGVLNATIFGNAWVGGIVGEPIYTDISRSYLAENSTINGFIGVGGLVGIASNTTITESLSIGNVNGIDSIRANAEVPDRIGGIAGSLDKGNISNSYSLINVGSKNFSNTVGYSAIAYYLGGLVGKTNSTIKISNSYFGGLIEGSKIYSKNDDTIRDVGMVVGQLNAATYEEVYFIGDGVQPATGELTLAQAIIKTNYSGYEFTGSNGGEDFFWKIDDDNSGQTINGGLPYLWWQYIEATSNLGFVLTTPAADQSNIITIDQANKIITVNVSSGTTSVTITGSKTDLQLVAKAGTDQSAVSITNDSTNPIFVINMTGSSTKSFDLKVIEFNKLDVTYSVTINITQ